MGHGRGHGVCPRNTEDWLTIADTLLCVIIFFPLCVLHWRGTWDLLDVYVYPEDEVRSNWTTLIVGWIACMVLTGQLHPLLVKYIDSDKHNYVYLLLSRLYLYINGWFILCVWRGTWDLMDIYLGECWGNAVVTYVISCILSVAFRVVRTAAGVPAGLQADVPDMINIADTRFRSSHSNPLKHFADVAITQLLIVTLGIVMWRGIWNLLDAFLLSGDHFWSDVLSLILGYFLLLIMYILQYPMSVISRKLDTHPVYKIAFEDIVFLTATWAVLLVWRGAWDLIKAYLIPDLKVGGWVCHFIGAGGLMAFQGLSNVGTNNIDIDGDYMDGEGIFATQFLRVLFKYNVDNSQRGEHKEALLQDCDDDVHFDVFPGKNQMDQLVKFEDLSSKQRDVGDGQMDCLLSEENDLNQG